jgi:hypothetical protein
MLMSWMGSASTRPAAELPTNLASTSTSLPNADSSPFQSVSCTVRTRSPAVCLTVLLTTLAISHRLKGAAALQGKRPAMSPRAAPQPAALRAARGVRPRRFGCKRMPPAGGEEGGGRGGAGVRASIWAICRGRPGAGPGAGQLPDLPRTRWALPPLPAPPAARQRARPVEAAAAGEQQGAGARRGGPPAIAARPRSRRPPHSARRRRRAGTTARRTSRPPRARALAVQSAQSGALRCPGTAAGADGSAARRQPTRGRLNGCAGRDGQRARRWATVEDGGDRVVCDRGESGA